LLVGSASVSASIEETSGMSDSTLFLGDLLDRFRALESVELAAVVASDGLLIETRADEHVDVDAVCAVASNSLAMAEALGREIDKGSAVQTMFEYEQGLVVLEPINPEAMLLLLTNIPEEIGHLRFLVALHRNELFDAVEAI
jgi:hypothetical protein